MGKLGDGLVDLNQTVFHPTSGILGGACGLYAAAAKGGSESRNLKEGEKLHQCLVNKNFCWFDCSVEIKQFS